MLAGFLCDFPRDDVSISVFLRKPTALDPHMDRDFLNSFADTQRCVLNTVNSEILARVLFSRSFVKIKSS